MCEFVVTRKGKAMVTVKTASWPFILYVTYQ